MRGVPGRIEVSGRAMRQRGGLGIGGPEVGAITDRLFEMIAEDLRARGEGVRDADLEPVGVTVVQLGSKRLGDRAINRLLDEVVPEAVFLMGASVGPGLHQAFGDEGLEVTA